MSASLNLLVNRIRAPQVSSEENAVSAQPLEMVQYVQSLLAGRGKEKPGTRLVAELDLAIPKINGTCQPGIVTLKAAIKSRGRNMCLKGRPHKATKDSALNWKNTKMLALNLI